MAQSLFVAAAGPETGKSAVVLGVMEAMSRRVGRVGVFRPVVRAGVPDPLVETLRRRYRASIPDEVAAQAALGVTYDEVHADPQGAIEKIIDRYHRMESEYDVVLVVGTDFTDVGALTELSFNGAVALNLGAPVLLVVNGRDRAPADVVAAVEIAQTSLAAQSCEVVGVIANRVAAGDLATVRDLLGTAVGGELTVDVMPELPLLSAPRVGQIFSACEAELLLGSARNLDDEVPSFLIGAMTLPRVLNALPQAGLVIIPGDRSDMLVGVLSAHASQTFPRLSGLLLTGGVRPEPIVQRLIDGLDLSLPVGYTKLNTFNAALRVNATRGALVDGSSRKVLAALDLFSTHVDGERLLDRLSLARSNAVTPLMFEHDLVEKARARRTRIVLPEGTEPRVLRAAGHVLRRGIADVILLGEPGEVSRAADRAGADITGATVLDPHEEGLRARLAAEYLRQRAHKGVTEEIARDRVVDVSYAGTLMVALGEADGMVSGAVHTTAHTIRPSFEVIRTVPGVSVVSSVFFMCLADRVLVYGDCAVNPDPTAEQLADIAISSAATAAAFGIEPRVAMLSYSTGSSGAGADVDKVRQATDLVRTRAPHLAVEGPIQYDAAIDVGVASTKLPDSAVAGHATVFVFPDLNTGNNTYKAVQRSANALAVGPVLQGLNRPVNDLSRGATVRDIITTIAITAVQAQMAEAARGGEQAAQGRRDAEEGEAVVRA
ncbi:MAG: phosphate acetyltransferase [Kineosporiaceae bacterium]